MAAEANEWRVVLYSNRRRAVNGTDTRPVVDFGVRGDRHFLARRPYDVGRVHIALELVRRIGKIEG